MIVGTFSMAEPNSTYRVNYKGMEDCCRETITLELYRRKDAGEEL
jgi:hypothetical protein